MHVVVGHQAAFLKDKCLWYKDGTMFDFGPVPNLLIWIATIAALISLPITAYLFWRACADRWAAGSAERALRRAGVVAAKFVRRRELRENVPELIVWTARAVGEGIFACIMVVVTVGISIIYTLEGKTKISFDLNSMPLLAAAAVAYILLISFTMRFSLVLFPILHFEVYQKRTERRLKRLFDAARLSSEEQFNFLQDFPGLDIPEALQNK